jgi:tetratricopeptide (TPR) repeat protein
MRLNITNLETSLNTRSTANTLRTPYQIPLPIYKALTNWPDLYNSAAIIEHIKTILQIDLNRPHSVTAETFNILANIKNFIHSTHFVSSHKLQKQYYLTYFFKQDLAVEKYSDEFNELTKALDEMIVNIKPISSTTSIVSQCLSLGSASYHNIAELFNFASRFNVRSINIAGFFMTIQIFMYFLQGAYAQTNSTQHSVIFAAPFNSSEPAFLPPEVNITRLQTNFDYLANYELEDLWQTQENTIEQQEEVKLLIQHANILLDRTDFNKALTIAKQIKVLVPAHPEIDFIIASVLLEQDGNYQKALQYYKKACALEPANKKYQFFQRIAEYFNAPQNTLNYYLHAHDFDPLVIAPERFMPPAKLFCTMNEDEFIASTCRANFNKQQVNTWLAKADNYQQHDNLEKALKYYDKALAYIPANDPFYNAVLEYLYLQKSIIYLSLQHYAAAEQSLKLVIALNTKPALLADIYFEYGNALINLFNLSMQNAADDLTLLEKSIAAYAKASKLKPDNPTFASMHAEAHELRNNWQTAIQTPGYHM